MAATATGSQLTEAHRLAQARLRAETFVKLAVIWPALDPTDLTRTWPAVEAATTALVQTGRSTSARLTAVYLDAYVQAETGTRLRAAPVLADTIDADRLATSLRVTGPVTVKRATVRGLTPERAARLALTTVAGAALRHVLDGHRDTQLATALNEGFNRYSRITDGQPCSFCAMLASRGPVYLTAETGRFEAHDRCGCTAEVVVAGDGWTPQARRLRAMWNQTTRGERDQAYAFRRAWEGRPDGVRQTREQRRAASRSGRAGPKGYIPPGRR